MVKSLRFADDIDVVTSDVEDANEMLLESKCTQYMSHGIDINIDKGKKAQNDGNGWNKETGGGARWSRTRTSQDVCIPRFNSDKDWSLKKEEQI